MFLCPSGNRKAPVHIYHPSSGQWHVVNADTFRRIEPHEEQLLLCGLPDGLASAANFDVTEFPGLRDEIASFHLQSLPFTPRKRARLSGPSDIHRSRTSSGSHSSANLSLPPLTAVAFSDTLAVVPPLVSVPPPPEKGDKDTSASMQPPTLASLLKTLECELPPLRRAFTPRMYGGKESWPFTYPFRDIFCGFITFNLLSQNMSPRLSRQEKLSRIWPNQDWSSRGSGFDKARRVLGCGSPLLWVFMLADKTKYWGEYSLRITIDMSPLSPQPQLPWDLKLKDEIRVSMMRIHPFWDNKIKKVMKDLDINPDELAGEHCPETPPIVSTSVELECPDSSLPLPTIVEYMPSSPSYHPSEWTPASSPTTFQNTPSSPSYHPSVWSPSSSRSRAPYSPLSPVDEVFSPSPCDLGWCDQPQVHAIHSPLEPYASAAPEAFANIQHYPHDSSHPSGNGYFLPESLQQILEQIPIQAVDSTRENIDSLDLFVNHTVTNLNTYSLVTTEPTGELIPNHDAQHDTFEWLNQLLNS